MLPVHTLSVRGIPPDGCPALTLRPKLAARSIYVDAHVDLCPGDLRALTRKSDQLIFLSESIKKFHNAMRKAGQRR